MEPRAPHLTLDWIVGPIPAYVQGACKARTLYSTDGVGKEVVVRIETSLTDDGGEVDFWTDANGRQMVPRK